jgi:acetyl esterase/lipase
MTERDVEPTPKAVVNFGAWESPVTTEMLVAGGVRFGAMTVDGQECYWTEGRAADGGRNVLVKRDAAGAISDVTSAPYNVRTRVHEYGGGAFTAHGGEVWFVNFDDQGLYHRKRDGQIHQLVNVPNLRFADFSLDAPRGRLLCVVEDHTGGGEPANYLGGISLDSGEIEVLASGHDFYSNPSISPDGAYMSWLTWDHPCMPWDGTTLWCAQLDGGGQLGPAQRITGGADVSVFGPQWSPQSVLYFVADPNGWWNLYRWQNGHVEPVHEGQHELGRAQWVFGMRTFGFVGERLLTTYCEQGQWRFGSVDLESGVLSPIETGIQDVDAVAFADDSVFMIGGSPDKVSQLVRLDVSSGQVSAVRASTSLALDSALISAPESVTFPTSEGDVAHGYFYAPRNPRAMGPAQERPPLIVIGHGGPTSSTGQTLSPAIQYWTSRGIAVLDVNYRGSTGYGRAYRDRLKEQWGVFDVADCVNGAQYLVERGVVDGARLAIRGGSAGGYTALAALTFHDTFTAGASYYGISELEALARDTHKFESRYLDQLIGPYPALQDRYKDRSPINFTDQLSCPVIFFQGLEDKVVPPNQAQMMVDALRAKGLPVAYIAFEGEQHGFRAANTIKRTLDAELYFYGRIFGFEPLGNIEPVAIAGLD